MPHGGEPLRKKQEQVRASRGCKKRGELAEMAFIYKAESLGFDIAKPYGESNRYDFILRSGQQFWKVQVKSSVIAAGADTWCMQKELGTGKSFRTPRMKLTFWLSTSCLRTHGSSSRSKPSPPTGASTSIPLEPPTEAATKSIAKPGGCWSEGILLSVAESLAPCISPIPEQQNKM
jgi:hypothetical protein